MALLRLQQLIGCGQRGGGACYFLVLPPSTQKKEAKRFVPSDSATMTAKYLTAPLASLNQEQLKRNKMEEDVTFDDLSLTRTLVGGTGGPGRKETGSTRCQSS